MPERRTLENALAVAWAIVTAWLIARCFTGWAPVESLDGAYQTFDAVQAVRSGHSLANDAPAYLGIGVSYLIVAFSWLFGGHVGEVNFAAHFVVGLCVALEPFVILRLLRFPTLWAASGSAFVLFGQLANSFVGARLITVGTIAWTIALSLGLAWTLRHRVTPLRAVGLFLVVTVTDTALRRGHIVLEPGGSLRPVRAALPYLAATLFFLGSRRLGVGMRQVALAAILAGACPFWSNDYGIPTAIALLGVTTAGVWRSLGWRAAGQAVLLFVPLAAGAWLALLLLVTGGSPGNYLQFNYGGVAKDQFWYFGDWRTPPDWPVPARIYTPGDALRVLLMPIAGNLTAISEWMIRIGHLVAIAWLGVDLWRGRTIDFARQALLLAALALSGGALLSQLGGHVEGEYALPQFVFSAVILPALAWRALALPPPSPPPPSRALAVFLGLWLAASGLTLGLGARIAAKSSAEPRQHVAELAGDVRPADMAAVQFGRALAKRAAATATPPNSRVFSTYFSYFDVVAGAYPPTHFPAIIHALGDVNRAEYLREFAEFHGLVTTVSPSWNPWGWYNVYASWPWFRELLRSRAPVAQSNQHLFWLPPAAATGPAAAPSLSCATEVLGPTRVLLHLRGMDPALRQVHLADVRIRYRVDLSRLPAWPVIGKRVQVFGDVRGTAQGDAAINGMIEESQHLFALPYYGTEWSFPVALRGSGPATVRLELDREEAGLTVTACEATLVGPSPFHALEAIPQLATLDLTALAARALPAPVTAGARE